MSIFVLNVQLVSNYVKRVRWFDWLINEKERALALFPFPLTSQEAQAFD
jgi:hypothetical protein